jgi:eukaryotic-like serine/threonine-protein kinase
MSREGVVEKPSFVPPGYSVMRKLGSGQTSHVYLANHVRLGQLALKLPREELYHRPVLRRMFENEVQITLSLKGDENVVTGFEGFPTGQNAFLALEYCSGGTLDQLLLERGKLSLEEASQLILDVSTGVVYTHNKQVLHRDVKPANVFMTHDKRAKLGDFGTGVFITEQKDDERVGTAFYMAPEIFEGKPANIQTDTYSLGILAYEVLAGARPFMGNSYEELMLQHLTGLPDPLRKYRPEISSELSQVIARAMSRDATRRYQSAQEFIAAYTKVTGFQPLSLLRQSQLQNVGRGARTPSKMSQTPAQPQIVKDPKKSQITKPKTPQNSSKQSSSKQSSAKPLGGLFDWFKRKKS